MLPHSSALSLAVRRRAVSEAQEAAQEAAACCCLETARAQWAAACRVYKIADHRADYTRRIVNDYGRHYTRAFGIWRRTESRIPYLSSICSAWCRAIGRLSPPKPAPRSLRRLSCWLTPSVRPRARPSLSPADFSPASGRGATRPGHKRPPNTMLDYNPADLGIEAPEADTTTHFCGCADPGCDDCNPHPGATAPAWWLAQPQPGEADEETNDLPF